MIDLSPGRRARARRWSLIAIAAAVMAAALAWILIRRDFRTVAAVPVRAASVPVIATQVVRHSLEVVAEGVGTVEAYNTVTVEPLIAGRLAQIDFVEGQRVRRGDIIARLDPRLLAAKLAQARAIRRRDEAKLVYGRANFARLDSVAAQGYVSRDLVDAQKAQVAVLAAAVAADRAAERDAQVQLSYTVIRAPIAGVTGIRLIDQGNVISPAGPGIVVITQVQPIAVVFTLPAGSLAAIPEGRSRRHLEVAAFDAADQQVLAHGTLALVDNRIDPRTNTVRLKAIFPNTRGTLRPGEFVNVHLRVASLQSARTVPRRAIQYGASGAFVWRLRADSTVQRQPVQVGVSEAGRIQVLKGLAAGDEVVLEGHYGLHPGTLVRLQTGAVAPPAGRGLLQVP